MKGYIVKVICLGLIALILPAFVPPGAPAAQEPQRPSLIRVVMDDNYPPYVFRGADGTLQGILIDRWRLWEVKTGMKAQITGLDWGEALRRMEAGGYDVIDTIFFNEKRAQIYEFSKPYAKIDVSIFFDREIGGIHDADSLKGFPVAVKRGDAAVDYLRGKGVSFLQEYPSYEAIIEAAAQRKVHVAVIDVPPALYFLHKKGLHDRFRRSAPLYTGEFHRAVRKGNQAVLQMVEEGFARISAAQYRAIDEKWLGEPVSHVDSYWRYFATAAGVLVLMVLAVVVWNRSLRLKVQEKTRALEEQVALSRKREEELRVSEEKYRSLYERSIEGIYQTTPEDRFLSANPALARMVGYDSPEELMAAVEDVGTRLYARAADREHVKRLLAEEGMVRGLETRWLDRDGRELWVRLNARAVRDEEGNVVCFEGTVEDITERKRAETALRESESFSRSLIRYLHDAVIVLSWEGEILFANESAAKIVELPAAEALVGRNMTDFLHPDSLPKAWEDSAAVRGGTEGFVSEYRLRTARGRDVWVEGLGGKIEFRGGEANIVCLRDITDRRQALEALKESEEKYRTLVENAGEAIFVAQDGKLAFVNRATCRFVGYAEEELVGRPFTEFIHPDDGEMVVQRYLARLRGDKVPDVYVFRVIHKNGTTLWGELRAVLIEWLGRPASLNFLTDITKRKVMEEERERLQAQLLQAQKMESVGRLAGGVAHDFNNMLQAILGYTDLALIGVDPNGATARHLLGIRRAAEHAAETTQQLLAFARRQAANPRLLDLNATVEGMLTMLSRLIGEDIDLVWSPGEGPLTIHMDPAQINQVLVNLCVNSRDAVTGTGRITIATAEVFLDDAFCSRNPGSSPGPHAMIAVSDTGCGMDKEILKNIFDPFFTTKEVGKGTGLGLAMVYGIVKQNDGYIEVDSEPGRGATFRIYLPLRRGEGDKEAQGTKAATGGALGGRETILVVEDETVILEMIAEMLAPLGYEVLTAATPAEALDIVGEAGRRIDLLITDVVMPGMNGRDLAERIRSLQGDVRCLFMSGYTAEIIARHGVPETGIGFLQKPFTMQELTDKVREALGRHEGGGVSAQSG